MPTGVAVDRAGAAVIVSVAVLVVTLSATGAPRSERVLDCRADFPATLSAGELATRFGADHVVTREIRFPEGESVRGTVVFPDSPAQLDVLWHDPVHQRRPETIRVYGERSDWRTREGVTLGTDLRTIERINRRPFRLLGFAWDYQGTVMFWSGGHLEQADTPGCRLRLRLSPPFEAVNEPAYRQVLGEREYSSGHPAMQALNPRVYELWLDFERPQE